MEPIALPPLALLFVYGTLRRGEPHHVLLASARYFGVARTLPHYRLLDLGPCPGIVHGGITAITGELYGVGPELLDAIDALEGHPMLYRRERIELDDGRRADTYLYQVPPGYGRREIRSGDWSSFRRVR
jgi:gamma-glutamylcyclotransferase (GGCT)/AIG2-like uncharacterized protein YtfP